MFHMIRMRRRTAGLALVAALAGGTAALTTAAAPKAVAFTKTWYSAGCPSGGLWDDVPAGDANYNEAGLLWRNAGQAADESCAYEAGAGVSTSGSPVLRVRAAVGDGSRLTVAAYGTSGEFPCAQYLGGTTIYHSESLSVYRTEAVLLSQNKIDCVRIVVDDDPNNSSDARISALIDDIRIEDSSNNSVKWRETFGSPIYIQF